MEALSGMLVIRKEKGYTSNDVVARLRGILKMKKIGHTGTLDPDAEGVLPVCLGNATKLVDLIADRDKEYETVARLGIRTDTQDLSSSATVLEEMPEGEVVSKLKRLAESDDGGDTEQACGALAWHDSAGSDEHGGPETVSGTLGRHCPVKSAEGWAASWQEAVLNRALQSFLGDYEQLPPMYSARKVNGRRLYEYARQGIEVERRTSTVRIHEITLLSVELPWVRFRVRCSKGTYIRTLCEDLGQKLGTGAAMEYLLRTRVGMFRLTDARTLGEIEQLVCRDEADPYRLIRPLVMPVDAFFQDCPAGRTAPEDDFRLQNGNALTVGQLQIPAAGAAAATGEGDAMDAGKKFAAEPCNQGGPRRGGAVRTEMPERVRAYDSQGKFCGLYKWSPEKSRYMAEKMFL